MTESCLEGVNPAAGHWSAREQWPGNLHHSDTFRRFKDSFFFLLVFRARPLRHTVASCLRKMTLRAVAKGVAARCGRFFLQIRLLRNGQAAVCVCLCVCRSATLDRCEWTSKAGRMGMYRSNGLSLGEDCDGLCLSAGCYRLVLGIFFSFCFGLLLCF